MIGHGRESTDLGLRNSSNNPIASFNTPNES
jgi:hypothetical protein